MKKQQQELKNQLEKLRFYLGALFFLCEKIEIQKYNTEDKIQKFGIKLLFPHAFPIKHCHSATIFSNLEDLRLKFRLTAPTNFFPTR